MSLYNLLFGTNENANELLKMINVPYDYWFERFRDVDLIDGGTKVRVLTRTGGGNREDYKSNWEEIRKHELYIRDYDVDYDHTYAYIEFNVDKKFLEEAKNMFVAEPLNLQDKYEKEIEEMSNPESEASKRAEILAKELNNVIENSDGGFIYL